MIEQIKQTIKQQLSDTLALDINTINIGIPKKDDADLAIPLFSFIKTLGQPVNQIYQLFSEQINKIDVVAQTKFESGFLNIVLNRLELSKQVLNDVYDNQENYGSMKINKTVVIDYSSPNIAKNFSVGHLRSTVIGNSLKKLYQKQGYQVIGVNHLGDWGTQFGRMIVAYQKWGNPELIKQNPITELQKLYVKFHEELANDPSLEEQGREAFLKLEQSVGEYVDLWRQFREESLKEFLEMYQLLDVDFDSYHGEAFYNDKMDAVVKLLEEKNLLETDQGAQIVNLGDDIPPALIKRTDGATLYITRDLAALLYRYNTYHFDKMIYVVGNEQKLHFEQLKRLVKLLGFDFDIEHVNFGLVLIDGKKMSTRSGQFAKLKDVILEATLNAKQAILEKNPNLADQQNTALAVGVGAIIFNDLKNDRHLDIDFNLANMLKFEGQTGPYLQYSVVRINSILRSSSLEIKDVDYDIYQGEDYFKLIKLIDQFPDIIVRATANNTPSVMARYLLTLSQEFNSFYGKYKIIDSDQTIRNTNLLLASAIKIVLTEGLRLLGIKALEAM